MTQITQVKWNTDKPKFEDVWKKSVVVCLRSGSLPQIFFILGQRSYDELFNGTGYSRVEKYAILSEEPVYCEWTETVNFLIDYKTSCGVHTEHKTKYCPFCGLPIKVIDELKPLPLMGIEPVINVTLGVYQCVWENNGDTIISIADTKKVHAIESWNLLVKKLTGEK